MAGAAAAHFRRWWWAWGLALLLGGLGAVPFRIRQRGKEALEETFARHRAEGLGSEPRDLLPGAPPIDCALQSRWRALSRTCRGSDFSEGLEAAERWAADGRRGAPPSRAIAALEESRAAREIAAALLREGRPFAGALGAWIADGTPEIRGNSGYPFEDPSGLGHLHQALALESLLVDDPGPALEAMDALATAFDRPGSILDAIVGCVRDGARDRAFAFLAWEGRLPADAESRWLAEPPKEPRRMAEGYRGERLLHLGPLARGVAAGTVPAASLLPGSAPGTKGILPWPREGGTAGLDWWLRGSGACARLLDGYERVEASLREGKPPPALDPGESPESRLASEVVGSLRRPAAAAFEARQDARCIRLFVRILRMTREAGESPRDLEDLRARLGRDAALLDGGPLDLAILYEKPAPNRVRVRPDPGAPRAPALVGISLPVGPERGPESPVPPFESERNWHEAAVPR